MKRDFPKTRHALIVSLIAFVLHGAWEYAQCGPFFVHRALPPTHFSMLMATLGDVVLTWAAYLLVAVVSCSWFWSVGPWRWRQWLALVGAGTAFAVVIEYRATLTGRWEYTELAPLVPGTAISVVPLLQLLLLFPLTFWLARYWPQESNMS